MKKSSKIDYFLGGVKKRLTVKSKTKRDAHLAGSPPASPHLAQKDANRVASRTPPTLSQAPPPPSLQSRYLGAPQPPAASSQARGEPSVSPAAEPAPAAPGAAEKEDTLSRQQNIVMKAVEEINQKLIRSKNELLDMVRSQEKIKMMEEGRRAGERDVEKRLKDEERNAALSANLKRIKDLEEERREEKRRWEEQTLRLTRELKLTSDEDARSTESKVSTMEQKIRNIQEERQEERRRWEEKEVVSRRMLSTEHQNQMEMKDGTVTKMKVKIKEMEEERRRWEEESLQEAREKEDLSQRLLSEVQKREELRGEMEATALKIRAMEDERREERRRREGERLQATREKNDTLQKLLGEAQKYEDLKKETEAAERKAKGTEERVRELEEEMNKWQEKIQLMEEKEALSRKILTAEHHNQMEMTQSKLQRMSQEMEYLKVERAEEGKRLEQERIQLTEANRALSMSLLAEQQKNMNATSQTEAAENKMLKMEESLRAMEDERREERTKWDERIRLTEEKEALSRAELRSKAEMSESKLLKADERMRDLEEEARRTEQRFRDMEEQRREERNTWEEELLKVTREKEELLQCYLCERQTNEDLRSELQAMETKLSRTEQKMRNTEEEMREQRSQWEERMQLTEEKEALSQKFLSAEHKSKMEATESRAVKMEVRLRAMEEECREERSRWEEERTQLTREREQLSQRMLSEQRRSEDAAGEMRAAEGRFSRMEEKVRVMEEERREEKRKWEERMHLTDEREALSRKFLPTEHRSEMEATLEDKTLTMKEKMKQLEKERREEWKKWEEELINLTRENEALSERLLSEEQRSGDAARRLEAMEEQLRRAEEQSHAREKEERSAWDQERLRTSRETEELSQRLVSEQRRREEALSEAGSRENKLLTLEQSITEMEEEKREERRMWQEREALAQKFLLAEHRSQMEAAEAKLLRTEARLTETEDERREEARRWEELSLQATGEKEELLQRVLSEAQSYEHLRREMEMAQGKVLAQLEERIRDMEEDIREERKRWDEEKVDLMREKEALSEDVTMGAHVEASPEDIQEMERNEQVAEVGRLCSSSSTEVHRLTLDPNTAHRNLSLSENNGKVTRVRDLQFYDQHQERFDSWEQVLCKEGLSGRCYWEVEWSGRVSIALTYRTINRGGVGGDCGLGFNDKSWSLECYEVRHCKRYSIRHNRETIILPAYPSGSNRIGVYLDSPSGCITFYKVSSKTRTHLHTFNDIFTEALYPGFTLGSESSLSLSHIEVVK